MQRKSKAYTDRKVGATAVFFRCGLFVQVKKPGIIPKTQCKFSISFRVMEKRGHYSCLPLDSRCWNASYLSPVSCQKKGSDSELSPLDFVNAPETMHPGTPTLPSRPIRLRGVPGLKIMCLDNDKGFDNVLKMFC